jgi:hypothetical protein
MTTEKTGDVRAQNASKESARNEPAGVDPVLQGSIGRKLRDAYQEVVNEEVPAKFLTLLQELKKKESGSGGAQ